MMLKRRTQLMLLLAAVVALTAAAFLLLDFRVQQAQMAVDSTSETYAFSITEESPLPLEQDLDLYVAAPPELEEALIQALRGKLRANPYVRDITFQERSPAPAADSVLVVDVSEPGTAFWSPVYARTRATVDVAYASDGEVTWIDEREVHLNNEGVPSPVVRVRAEHTFDGSAYGLISGPGYAQYLAEEMAQTITQSLADTLARHGRT